MLEYISLWLWCGLVYRVGLTAMLYLRALFVYRILPLVWRNELLEYRTRWTLCTGCAQGIGRAYTLQLLERGLTKLVLVDRNGDTLRTLKTLIVQRCKSAEVITFEHDFLTDDYASLHELILSKDVGFLCKLLTGPANHIVCQDCAVHAVGIGPAYPQRFGDQVEFNERVMQVNTIAPMRVLQTCVNHMRLNGGGQIVLIASVQGRHPVPKMSTYNASKVALRFMADAIRREYATDGICVQVINPIIVATAIVKMMPNEANWFAPVADVYVEDTIKSLGVLNTTAGSFSHEIQDLAYTIIPWALLQHLVTPLYNYEGERMRLLTVKANAKST